MRLNIMRIKSKYVQYVRVPKHKHCTVSKNDKCSEILGEMTSVGKSLVDDCTFNLFVLVKKYTIFID